MARGALYINGKFLKCRCLKWARIAHLDIWNTSYGQKKARESNSRELPRVRQFWLPTTRSRESTRNTWLQTTCHISLESSRRELQLCFRPHCDRSSAQEVMRPQSPGSPSWRDFGTPAWESWERKAIWMLAPWRGKKYTIKGKVVTSPSSGRGEFYVSKCPWQVPTPKGVPNAKLTSCGWFLDARGKVVTSPSPGRDESSEFKVARGSS
jgi:hypothetical protein